MKDGRIYRAIKVLLAVCALAVAYLFALNGRYEVTIPPDSTISADPFYGGVKGFRLIVTDKWTQESTIREVPIPSKKPQIPSQHSAEK